MGQEDGGTRSVAPSDYIKYPRVVKPAMSKETYSGSKVLTEELDTGASVSWKTSTSLDEVFHQIEDLHQAESEVLGQKTVQVIYGGQEQLP